RQFLPRRESMRPSTCAIRGTPGREDHRRSYPQDCRAKGLRDRCRGTPPVLPLGELLPTPRRRRVDSHRGGNRDLGRQLERVRCCCRDGAFHATSSKTWTTYEGFEGVLP